MKLNVSARSEQIIIIKNNVAHIWNTFTNFNFSRKVGIEGNIYIYTGEY